MLGPLESEVIGVLERLRQATAREIHEALPARWGPVAYTTVNTILTRLHAKGLVRRRREKYRGGERYVYEYKDIEQAYLRSVVSGVVRLFGRRGVVHLAEQLDGLSEAELRALEKKLGP